MTSSTSQEFVTNVYFAGTPRDTPLPPNHVDAETFLRTMEERAFKCGWNKDEDGNIDNKRPVQHVASFLTKDAATWFYSEITYTYGEEKYGKRNEKMSWDEFRTLFSERFKVVVHEYDCDEIIMKLTMQGSKDTPMQFAAKVIKAFGQAFDTLEENPNVSPSALPAAAASALADKATVRSELQNWAVQNYKAGIKHGRDEARKMLVMGRITRGVTNKDLRKALIKLRTQQPTMADFMIQLRRAYSEIEEADRTAIAPPSSRNGNGHNGNNSNNKHNGNNGNNNGNKARVNEIDFNTATDDDISKMIAAGNAALRSRNGNASQGSNGRGRGRGRGGGRKPRDPNAFCTFCQIQGHKVEDCFSKKKAEKANEVANTDKAEVTPKPQDNCNKVSVESSLSQCFKSSGNE